MAIFLDTLGFAARGAVVFLTFAACVAVLVGALRSRRGPRGEGHLVVTRLGERYERRALELRSATLSPKAAKLERKSFAAASKRREPRARRVFVLDFKGDVLASAVEHLREEVSAILDVARKDDRVVIRIESPGGAAHGYGFAASQVARLRDRHVHVTACVDRVAASGGYMMACVADEIVAAPFAIVGSIGVAAPLPNAHRLLERHGVDYETATAGRYKRTVTFFGEVTDEGRRKFQEQLEETHALFKGFVKRYRGALDVESVATGEYWHGERGLELGLVDRLATSDDVLIELSREADLYSVRHHAPQRLQARLAAGAAAIVEQGVGAALLRLRTPFT